jgi:hypothetical protein
MERRPRLATQPSELSQKKPLPRLNLRPNLREQKTSSLSSM